ncbi:MAG: S8 family serine peptidase [Armatimonas sp.]
MKKALLTIATLLTCLFFAIAAFAAGGEKVAPGQVLVRVPAGTTEAAVRSLAERHGCDFIRALSLPGWYVVARKDRNTTVREEPLGDTLQQTVAGFANEPGVLAEPDRMTYPTRQTPASTPPNDTLYASQKWHYEMIKMPQAWAIQDGDSKIHIRVGVADSGIDATHPDFLRADGTSRIVAARDFSGNNTRVDLIGHGTHVSGTIAASTNNSAGVAGIGGWEKNGVNIDLVDARVFHDGGAASSTVTDAMKYLADQGCKVINLSLGHLTTGAPEQVYVDAVNYVRSLGVIVVVAAGNDSVDNDGTVKAVPADVPGVLKVTAVGPTRNLSSYSNFGGNVFVAAPGGDGAEGGPDAVWSTVPIAGSQIAPASAGGYYSINGTSMACPHVAGAIAVMVATGATEPEIVAAIQATAQTPPGGKDPKRFGAGILNLYDALLLVSNPTPRLLPESTIVDRGVTYLSPLSLKARLFGTVNMIAGTAAVTGKQVHQSDVNIDIYRIGDSTPFKTFQGGRDFLIPALKSGERKSTSFTVDVPSKADDPTLRPTDPGVNLPDYPLPLGNDYKIVYRIGTTIYGTQFIKLDVKRIPAGRSMFALPFKAGLATGASTASKEQLLLGTAVSFGLSRYNPLRLPSEEDYARYRSNGSVADPAARFVMGATSRGPLTYDIADPATSIAPIGVGYWLDLADDTAVDTLRLTDGREDASGLEATNAVAIRVFASGGGWNMIGAPFTYPVEWSSVTVQVDGVNYSLAEAINNGMVSPALVGYDAERRDYVYSIAPDGVMKPFNSYWVRAYKDATIIVPPSQSATRAAGRPIKSEGWTGRLIASVGGDQDGQNYFGQVRGAVNGEDRLDIPKPPMGSGHAYVRFEQKADQATRALAFDLREPNSADKQTWRAAVSSDRSNADVTLSWEGLRYVPRRYKVTLLDETTGQTVAMQGRASYRYRSGEAGATRYFQIVLEPQASGGPLLFSSVRTENTGTRSQGTTVRFLLSQDAEVVGTVRSLSGKVVGTLTGDSRVVARKEASLRWTGRAQDGGGLPAGAYVLDITARTADGSTARMTRTVQHLR